MLHSITLDVGTFFWQPPDGAFRERPGLEVGLGFEIPILESASGPRFGAMGSLRVSHGDTGGANDVDLDARSSAMLLTFSWHQIVDAGLVDAGDALNRQDWRTRSPPIPVGREISRDQGTRGTRVLQDAGRRWLPLARRSAERAPAEGKATQCSSTLWLG